MIKLIGIFDKALGGISLISNNEIEELIIDAMSEIDPDEIPCPMCGRYLTEWNFCRCRKHSFIWDDPGSMIQVHLPEYSYSCHACGSTGYETFSTDISIYGSQLSFHYLFKLFREVSRSQRTNPVERDYLLYAQMSEESLKAWHTRFYRDFYIVKKFAGSIDETAFLSERITYGYIFQEFFEMEHRFFLHKAPIALVHRAFQ